MPNLWASVLGFGGPRWGIDADVRRFGGTALGRAVGGKTCGVHDKGRSRGGVGGVSSVGAGEGQGDDDADGDAERAITK